MMEKWHHDIHQVTGEMAKEWTTVTKTLLQKWASELRAVADDMVAKPKPKPKKPTKPRGKK